MDINQALAAFDALSQETRLQVFRLLVNHGPGGTPAGTISGALNVPHNTLSFHLNHLHNAKLISSRREGRSIIYTADFDFFNALIQYMVKDCCSARFASIRSDKKRGCSIIELSDCCTSQPKGARS
ncbi:MAG: helix-turn-helix transcriptional regulator [Nitrospira sp.]